MLKLVRMEALADRRTSQISGGQQQRVALARALAPQPKVLLLDEPLSALDYKLRKEMQIELKRLQHETGITFIFVTHDQEEALTMSDRIAVMSAGKILQVGTPRDIYDRPAERFVADFIGETNFLDGDGRRRADGAAHGQACVRAPRSPPTVPEGFAPAGEVTVVVRPEHARARRGRAAAACRHASRTSSISAPTRIIHVRLDDGDAVHRAPAERAQRPAAASQRGDARRHRDRRRRRAGPEGLSDGERGRGRRARRQRDDVRDRWLLSAPALLIILLAAIGPLLIVLRLFLPGARRLRRREVAVLARRLGQRASSSATSSTTRCRLPTRICRSSGAR